MGPLLLEKPKINTGPAASELFGVRIACIDITGLMSQVQEWVALRQPRTIFYVNAHCMNLAYEHPRYRSVLQGADLVYPDGVGVVWASRVLGGCQLVKMTGADWIEDYCSLAEAQGLRTCVLAGEPGVARRAADALIERYPALKIVAAMDGYFAESDEDEVLAAINSSAADVLFVGMGVPRQEGWISEHRRQISVPVCWGVGALFDYVAGVEPRVPAWMYSIGLEWFWRLLVDPSGKWSRYLVGNPVFAARVLRERFARSG